MRWRDPRRGKGKRGGLRIIYLYVPDVHMVGILDVYDKDETEDLSKGERRVLAETAERVREQFRTRHYTGEKG